MRSRLALGTLVLLFLLLAPLPGRAAERGTIEGNVVNETTGRPQAGVKVVLSGARMDGSDRVEHSVVTRRSGRYVFDDLETGDDFAYALDAGYAGGLFAGRPISLPDNTSKPVVIDSTLRVWETTTKPGVISIERNDLFLLAEQGGVSVVDSYRVMNSSDRAYIGRGGSTSGERQATSTLAFPLPPRSGEGGVQVIESTIDIPELVPTEFGFGVTIAIPPGRTDVIFRYITKGLVGTYDVSRTALYPIETSSVFAAKPLVVDGNRFEADGSRTIGGKRYARYSTTGPVTSGDALQILATAEASGSTALIIGGAVGLGVISLAVLVGLVMRHKRRRPGRETRPSGVTAGAREELLVQVAELDVAYRAGRVTQDDWDMRRAELIAKLRDHEVPIRDARTPERTS